MASKDTTLAAVMEQLIAEGPQGMAQAMTTLMNLAMRMEREQYLGAGHYERSPGRRGYANGTKPKKIDTPVGTLTLDVPKTADTSKPFFPQSLERGRRSCRAVMLCAAEMYVKGVSTRAVEKVLAEFGIEGLSSTQVSRAAAMLDEELRAWRNRPLGRFRYLFLDARYEKTREQGVADDCAVLSAIGIDPSGKRRVLGVSVAFSEAEVHWRAFLESLAARGLQGVEFITSDDHPGLKAARKAVLPGARWQRCQFHLAQNAIHHTPNQAIRKTIGEELRAVWDAPSLGGAEEELKRLVAKYRNTAPKLAAWLEENVPEGLAVFKLPREHWRPMRTSNLIERSIQQELKRRTRKIRVFPNEASLIRLASAILVEIDEQWAASQKPYVNFNNTSAD
ncbi:MAG: IS256 family transposase [Rhodomicrobium sp.]